MSSRTAQAFSRLRTVWKNFVSKKESPRESQERHDLYKIALAATYRDLRKNAATATATATSSSSSSLSSLSSSESRRKELERIYDEATEILDQKGISNHSVKNLRREVQTVLRPQILSLLQVCQQSQLDLPSTTVMDQEEEEDGDGDGNGNGDSGEEGKYNFTRQSNIMKCKDVLYEEQHHTLGLLDKCYSDTGGDGDGGDNIDSNGDNKRKQQRQAVFLHKKLSAIETIASFYKWEHFYFSSSDDSNINVNTNTNVNVNANANTCTNDGADEFGYIPNKDEYINSQIRYYQMMNLSRSAFIRQQLGYSTIALKSTIQNSSKGSNKHTYGGGGGGRGIFLDGKAHAGSIVAFFPGEVWPKEHLINANSVLPYFSDDPKYHLSLRYDDILLDCRRAPYTVLDDVNSNAFAVAHIANHPPHPKYYQQEQEQHGQNEHEHDHEDKHEQILVGPNCCTTAIDFLDNMKLDKSGLDTFIPNTYKKHPMMLGPQAVDRDSITMHSMGLLTLRDVENEEIFYDYRLSSGSSGFSSRNGESLPDWYYVFNQEEVENRWHHK